jgi:hypothetical protein
MPLLAPVTRVAAFSSIMALGFPLSREIFAGVPLRPPITLAG